MLLDVDSILSRLDASFLWVFNPRDLKWEIPDISYDLLQCPTCAPASEMVLLTVNGHLPKPEGGELLEILLISRFYFHVERFLWCADNMVRTTRGHALVPSRRMAHLGFILRPKKPLTSSGSNLW